jgi:hypothetical protein
MFKPRFPVAATKSRVRRPSNHSFPLGSAILLQLSDRDREACDDRLLTPGRSALIVAHPGHELRVFGWLAQMRPTLHVLTAGDGAYGGGRAEESRAITEQLGCPIGSVFAAAGDRRVYDDLLRGEARLFIDLLERLVEGLIADDVEVVVGDAAEGYNPTHDLCRVLIDAAVRLVRHRSGRRLTNFALPLTEWDLGGEPPRQAVRLRISQALLSRKLAACRAYQGLEDEVDRALAAKGEAYFRDEVFCPIGLGPAPIPTKPHYEAVGQERVGQGVYSEALRFDRHVAPIARAIAGHAALELEPA